MNIHVQNGNTMRTIVVVLIAASCVGLLLSIYFTQNSAYELSDELKADSFNVSRARGAMRKKMNTTGSRVTYEEIKRAVVNEPIQVQHSIAHIFGELLYKQDGLSGLTICDDALAFGCYHSFFGAVVADRGVGIVEELDRVCIEKYGIMGLGCPHGIGHGLGEYFGYKNLDEQLAICERLAWKGRFFGCKGGVFMEYNTPLQRENENVQTSVRPFDADNPYSVCLSVADPFQPACFLELSAWWEQVLDRNYKMMATYCDNVEEKKNREACFLGIGYSAAPSSGYNIPSTLAVCNAIAGKEHVMLCRAGASWSFFANLPYRDSASEICQYNDKNDTSMCMQKAELLSY